MNALHRFHRRLTYRLWGYAVLLALTLVLSWIFGGLAGGWHIVFLVLCLAIVVGFVRLLFQALVEWRRDRRGPKD